MKISISPYCEFARTYLYEMYSIHRPSYYVMALQIYEWCKVSLSGTVDIGLEDNVHRIVLEFEYEADMMLFKMRWL